MALIDTTGLSAWLQQQGATALSRIFAQQAGNLLTQVILWLVGFGGIALVIAGIFVFFKGQYITKPLGFILVVLGVVAMLPALLLYL